MRLTSVLLLLTLTLTTWSPATSASTDDDSISSNTREKRLFFLPSITASIASWVGLNKEPPAPVTARPAAATIVYVQKASKKPNHPPEVCKSILSDAECPAGQVCSLSHTCVPKSAVNEPCLRDAQCASGSCHGYRCASADDHCHEGDGSCPPGKHCVLTSAGRRCKPDDTDTDTCASPLTPHGCPSGKFCDHSGHCTAQLATGEQCQLSLQCAGGVCREHVCRSDECPTLYTSRHCQDEQFCAPSPLGNTCHAQLSDGHKCVADAQCLSRRCERSRCVRHQCEEHAASASSGGCAAGEFCMPAQDGNMCMEKRPRGEWCSADVECLSGRCVDGKCYQDECPTPGRDDGCSTYKYCVSGTSGNSCVDKKTVNERCSTHAECLTAICVHNKCFQDECPAPGSDAGCPTHQYCTAALVGNICMPKKTPGTQCASSAECLSATCRDGQCVQDECTAPGSRFGCPLDQYCVSGAGSNMCVSQKGREAACYSSVECLSDVCVAGKCYQDLCSPLGSDDDCPRAQYCAASHLGNECVYKKPVGMGCVSGDECSSGDCRDWKCVLDQCTPAGQQDGCEKNQYCATGNTGNVCAMKRVLGAQCSDSVECLSGDCRNRICVMDQCTPVGQQDGCEKNQYCATGNTGNVCAMKRVLGAQCSDSVECLSGDCRNRICVMDVCSSVGSEDGCGTDQYCTTGNTGNVCAMKRVLGAQCSDSIKCLSGDCRNRICVMDECSSVGSDDSCGTGKYCTTGNTGNVCAPRKALGTECDYSFECLFNECRKRKCYHDECDTVGSDVGCTGNTFCSSGVNGNECVPKKPRGYSCSAPAECMSSQCTGSKCYDDECTVPDPVDVGHRKLNVRRQLSSAQDSCDDNRYCTTSAIGNECVPKRTRGEACDHDVQCEFECRQVSEVKGKRASRAISTNKKCYEEQCTEETAQDDCGADKYCSIDSNIGNGCLDKLGKDGECYKHIQCASGNCIGADKRYSTIHYCE